MQITMLVVPGHCTLNQTQLDQHGNPYWVRAEGHLVCMASPMQRPLPMQMSSIYNIQ